MRSQESETLGVIYEYAGNLPNALRDTRAEFGVEQPVESEPDLMYLRICASSHLSVCQGSSQDWFSRAEANSFRVADLTAIGMDVSGDALADEWISAHTNAA